MSGEAWPERAWESRKGKIQEAIGELKAALSLEPEYHVARKELRRLLGKLN
jgi:hypothetical protein